MQDIKPTGSLPYRHSRISEETNPWHLNRAHLLKCNSSENNNDYTCLHTTASAMDISRPVIVNQNRGFEQAVDTIADKMAPLLIPSVQVTSPPRSPRPRHRLEMRKKDLSVDRSEVSL